MALATALVSGCAQKAPAGADAPTASDAPAAESNGVPAMEPAGGRWSGIGKTCASLTGAGFSDIRQGVFVEQLELDAKLLYTATCAYGEPAAILALYSFDKGEPGESPGGLALDSMAEAKAAGNPVLELTSVGEGAVAYVEERGLVVATWSRNAWVRVIFPSEEVAHQAELAERGDELKGVLKDMLSVLR